MSLVERITQALDGTSPPPWFAEMPYSTDKAHVRAVIVDDGGEWREITAVPVWVADETIDGERAHADAELIAAAPGLLAECAQRLTPPDDVRELALDLIGHALRPGIPEDTAALLARAGLLLEQVFLDPQETQ